MPTIAPSIPQNLIAQQGDGQVYLSWDQIAGVTAYQLLRSIDNINYTTIATPVVPEYLDTSVIIGTTYYYKVASSNVISFTAYGTMTLTGLPAIGQSFSLANITFIAGTNFVIGANASITASNIVNAVNAALTKIGRAHV